MPIITVFNDIVTGELARQSSTIPSKLYRDFLKSVLTNKVHLNAVLKRMFYLPAAKIKTAVVPMIQVMRLSCSVYGMYIIDKKVYTLQRISYFRYPNTQREVKSGGIKPLLDGFSLVKNIEEMIIEYSRTPNNGMRNIKNGRMRKSSINTIEINYSEYIEDEVNEQGDDEQEGK
ncbi:MAG: hypothetical protein EXX96DRAFT_596917 [Benjaminiella poitrasii]|nr:MAG: hypothetical protein EXX96DRAFT_596917 [Benjaminiella poitrasii]